MNKIKTILITTLFLPVLLTIDTFKSKRSIWRKIGYFLLVLIFFGFTWISGYQEVISLFQRTSYEAGITDKLTKVQVSGTSMLPTIKDGSEVELKSPKKYGLTRGDIVSFKNDETRELHYLKRIVGLPGEQVSFKNGTVFINGKALQEDYTLNNLPTYGNTELIDCESYTIPKDHFMVLGDNRTVSSDSRVIGFVATDAIDGVIKANIQTKYASAIRQKELAKATVDPEVFLKSLNAYRVKSGVQNLVTHTTLNQLAQKRAEQIRDKFSDWKQQLVPVDKLLEVGGYRFNKVHEFVTFGYLDEQAIIDQIFDSSLEKDQFLSNQYTEVGIGVTEKTNKECTFPVTSVILSWPAVPTYDPVVLDSWTKEISINNESLSNLQTWIGTGVDEVKLKKLIGITADMQQIATRIYNKEKNREWLTQKDYQDIQLYDQLVKQSITLNAEIFGTTQSVKGTATTKEAPRRY